MTISPKIDVRDLNSVRKAARPEVVLGDDYVAPYSVGELELQDRRSKRGLITLNRSPLARKIITFNLLALIVLVAGVLYLNPARDSLAFQRGTALVSEAELIADVFEAQIEGNAPVNLVAGDGLDVMKTLESLDLRSGIEVFVYDVQETLVGSTEGMERRLGQIDGLSGAETNTVITDFLNRIWSAASNLLTMDTGVTEVEDAKTLASKLVGQTLESGTQVKMGRDVNDLTLFTVSTPIIQEDRTIGVIALTSAAGEIDLLVRSDREQILQMFVIAILVSIGLSLVLASTIANPLSDLAAAAELGRDKNARKMTPGRIRIPDLTARPDEIGRLSSALRGMVAALYDRIDANEQFAADVAHEIKNPLASLRSAVGTMRVAKRDDQREKLLDVIDHDVSRLDRLVTDIAGASRLDSELVKEEEQPFDLIKMIKNLNEFLSEEAAAKGVEYIADVPGKAVRIQGLEARLAQVFVNLITNAISFCEEGDAIRVWARRRENRVLIVVEDTGPGIPEGALNKIFQRFYSERPEAQFGNNSGLGLAISKQIVEAHGGVIWAENIRPTDADITSEPLGARFVVGLPI